MDRYPVLTVDCPECCSGFSVKADFDQKDIECPGCKVMLTVDRVEYLVAEKSKRGAAS